MEVNEFGLAESFDEDDFNEKLTGLKPRWEKLCPGFHKWFITHRKKDFIESVIRTAREGTSMDGFFYQNDIESLNAAQKRIQCFKSQDVLGAVQTMEKLIQREENDEVMAIYGGSYVLSQDYANGSHWYGILGLLIEEARTWKSFESLYFHSIKPFANH